MISVEEFSKKFGDFSAVRDVSFTVEDGEVFGIVGPNGAGKSTIVKMLAAFLVPAAAAFSRSFSPCEAYPN
ncbi:MAG: ATP-binding cassette domain-containing protein [Candidatus Micrarchaeota archaeon]|nr:ATP-binding cassette domain-containing protein [Candidatus Micrarchaeota archaeon]